MIFERVTGISRRPENSGLLALGSAEYSHARIHRRSTAPRRLVSLLPVRFLLKKEKLPINGSFSFFELLLRSSSNFFQRKLLKLSPLSLPPANFFKICVPKTENFSFLLKKKQRAQNQKNVGKFFRFWSSENSERRKRKKYNP